MTIPREEIRALHGTREFMNYLLTEYNSKTKSSQVKEKARQCLRHYPTAMTVERVYKREVEIWEGDLKGFEL